MSVDLKLGELFSQHTPEQWREVVETQLKGAPFEKLVKKSYEGIDIKPLYTDEDTADLDHVDAMPGSSPYVRGVRISGHTIEPWDIAQAIPYPDAGEFNKAVLKDLMRGQTALNLPLDSAFQNGLDPKEAGREKVGKGGVSVYNPEDMEKALDRVMLEHLNVLIDPGTSAIAFMGMIDSFLKKQGASSGILKGAIFFDPLGKLAVEGEIPLSIEDAWKEMASLIAWAKQNAPNLKTLGVSGFPYHNGGGHAVQELAFAIATAVEYIRELTKLGLSVDDVASSIMFGFSVGSDFFMEIAKMRAARLVWENVVEAFGGNAESAKLNMHLRTSSWNKTKYDPFVNMLRVTTEAFSGICGGCDSMHVTPFDEPFGLPSEFSRRIAKNVHIVLKEECHFDKVIDPAGGSWYVEAITDQVAKKSWELFQEVEKMGGMVQALTEGFCQNQVAETAKARAKNIATRKDVFVGTNKYVNLYEKPVKIHPFNFDEFYQKRKEESEQYSSGEETKQALDAVSSAADNMANEEIVAAVSKAAEKGATVGEISRELRKKTRKTEITPVCIYRGAEEYENVRHATYEYGAKTGAVPKIFLANIGPIPQHKPRADFSIGFFEVAGFEVINNAGFSGPADAADAALGSGAKVTVICSTDDVYPEVAPPLARQLKEADPDMTVIVAGYPKEHIESFKEAGVDDFIHLRSNCLEQLKQIQKKLGVTS